MTSPAPPGLLPAHINQVHLHHQDDEEHHDQDDEEHHDQDDDEHHDQDVDEHHDQDDDEHHDQDDDEHHDQDDHDQILLGSTSPCLPRSAPSSRKGSLMPAEVLILQPRPF